MTENNLIHELAQAIGEELDSKRTKAVSSTPSATYGHGNTGLFSAPGMSQDIFSAMILPRHGLQSRLPVMGTTETNPLYGIMTGTTDSSGSNPEGVCDDPPIAGLAKLCTHTFVFGRYSRMTPVYDTDRVGQVTNRGEFTDFVLRGTPFVSSQPNVPSGTGAMSVADVARNEIAKALFEFGATWSKDFAKQIYAGNPTNNTAGGGYKEFYGLDALINTGYRDAETGVACPAADSIVVSFGDVDLALNGNQFVANTTNVMRRLRHIASNAGLAPVLWEISMHPDMFYEACSIWPINYSTFRGLTSLAGLSSVNFNIDSNFVNGMRDRMLGDLYNYTGQFLMIDGQPVSVCLDDAIDITDNGDGSFTGDVYFNPMNVIGGIPSMFWSHYKYDVANGSLDLARQFAPADSYFATDGGRFLWHKKPPTNFCVQMLAKMEPRVMLLTPHLAARMTDVRYAPVYPVRSPFSDSNYFVDGGKTDRGDTPISYYSPTS